MRIIDADASKKTYTADLFDTEEDFERVNDIFDYAPTVDAEVVVRCRNCEYYKNHPNGLCYLHTEPKANRQGYSGEAVCVEPDDFAVMGCRRRRRAQMSDTLARLLAALWQIVRVAAVAGILVCEMAVISWLFLMAIDGREAVEEKIKQLKERKKK